MKNIVWLFIAVVAVAAISSFATMRWTSSRPTTRADEHQWLHDELMLTPEQHAKLEPIETAFAAQNQRLSQQLKEANHELAEALRKGNGDSADVKVAVEKIHITMGELQKAAIQHLFDMRKVLTPEQGDRLFQLAQKALESTP